MIKGKKDYLSRERPNSHQPLIPMANITLFAQVIGLLLKENIRFNEFYPTEAFFMPKMKKTDFDTKITL